MVAKAIFALLLGVVWVIYTGIAGGVFLGPTTWAVMLAPGFYLFTIALVAGLPWLCRLLPGVWGGVLAFAVLTGAHAFVVSNMGVAAPWFKVAALSGVYALFAIFAFRAMGGFQD
jgi:hypothetical protein